MLIYVYKIYRQRCILNSHDAGFGAKIRRETEFWAKISRETGFRAKISRETGFRAKIRRMKDPPYPPHVVTYWYTRAHCLVLDLII